METSSKSFEDMISQMIAGGISLTDITAKCNAVAARFQPPSTGEHASTSIVAHQPAPGDGPGAMEQLGSNMKINFIVNGASLLEQTPFKPQELASFQFKLGTKNVYALSAPCRSGKSLSMAFLSLKAIDAGCWVLILLNIVNNQAISSLEASLKAVYRLLGIAADIHVVTDEVFLKRGAQNLEYRCEQLQDPNSRSVWLCRADQAPLEKLLATMPVAAWSRCVVMLDEEHCFFTLQKDCKKKAELNLISILFGSEGATRDKDLASVASMRVRSLVVSDATDADVPHILKRFKCSSNGFLRICADPKILYDRGYVSASDLELFQGKKGRLPMLAPFSWKQRYGKDIREEFPCKERKDSSKQPRPLARLDEAEDLYACSSSSGSGSNSRGKDFAEGVTRDHFAPVLRHFLEDALDPDTKGEYPYATFLMEIITNDKCQGTDNSVEHHARGVARNFPGAQCLAEHGDGCFHFRENGTKRRFKSLKEAYDTLQASPDSEYYGKPKYLCTNIGRGGMQYAHPGAPITHIHIGFSSKDTDNLLVRVQGLGRSCGFVREDLDRCGGKVQVLCTRKDFDAMCQGLLSYTTQAYAHFPEHISAPYPNRVVRDYTLAHASNPLAKEARKKAIVPAKEKVPKSGGSTALQDSYTPGDTGASDSGGDRDGGGRGGNRGILGGDGSASDGDEDVSPRSRAKGVALTSSSAADAEAMLADLHSSVEQEVDVLLGPERALVHQHGTITISEPTATMAAIRVKHPGVLITSKVIFLKGNEQQHKQGVEVATDLAYRPASTDFAAAIKAQQASYLIHPTPHMAFMSPQRSDVAGTRFNRNPARFGSRGRGSTQIPYNTMWAYDVQAQQAVAVLKTVPHGKLALPFIYHQMVFEEAGGVSVRAMLVSKCLSVAKPPQSKKRARQLQAN